MIKVCGKCELEKSVTEFHRARGRKSGRQSYCKSCRRAYEDSDQGKAARKKYNQSETAQTYRASGKRRKAALKYSRSDRARSQILQRLYGVTIEEYYRIFTEQKGVCAICGKKETWVLRGKIVELSVDHDHRTGKVRGLLCHKCNPGLGNFNDSPKLMEKAIAYVRRYQKNS